MELGMAIWMELGMVFGGVLEGFFGPKINAKNNLEKNVREPFCSVKTNTDWMLALSQEKNFRAKIDEKLHVLGEFYLEGIFGGL